jgi:Ni2+-binding GTPase involved in maturation of urease and hydrogenase
MSRARYIMIGGFLGAGKTTTVARLAQHLSAQGRRIGLITNDQGSGLVDTAVLRARGFATEEIPGGCFCCRFNSLLDAARKLTAATRPDVFIAEPVGSCTDLVATVTYPLRRIYGNEYTVAPLSVLVDPIRASRIFGLERGARFSDKVRYIYRKQLEEADLLIINKADLLEEVKIEQLRATLRSKFPGKEVLVISARTGLGLEDWFERVTAVNQPAGEAINVDYAVYAEGEALLGWLNATVQVSSQRGTDANQLLRELAAQVQTRLNQNAAEVAHLKMTLSPDEGLGDIAAISLVRNDLVPELSLTLSGEVYSGQLIINLRAEAAPDQLKAAVQDALAEIGCSSPHLSFRMKHLEHFRPGRPQPTHRDTKLTSALKEPS